MSTENDETILGGSEPAPGPAKKSGGNPSAGMSAVPAGQLETGARLGDYEIERLLGAGAMGEVYLARQ
ncbi:MAG TPA: hypothetical protein PKI32_04495, partial [Opitutales bacterium]|nr:hypothetical protein [Opitutales bacterium]